MICPCLLRRSPSVCLMHIGSPVFDLWRGSWACSVIDTREWFGWFGAQKNGLRGVRARAIGLVRPQAAARARSVLRGLAHLPGARAASALVSKLCAREARASGVFDRQCTAH